MSAFRLCPPSFSHSPAIRWPRPMSGYEAMIREVRFAEDSPLEGNGFEPSVPGTKVARPTAEPNRGQTARIEQCLRRSNRPREIGRSRRAIQRLAQAPAHLSRTLSTRGGKG